MIQEMKFVWAAMMTPLLLGGRREENTALTRCNSMPDMLAANAAIAGCVDTERRARVGGK